MDQHDNSYHVTADEFLNQFDRSIWDKIAAAIESNGSTHVVCFENQDFCSSHFGERTCLTVGGTNNTYKSPEECRGKHLGDLPSIRQYAVNCADAKEVQDYIEKCRA
jgi:hypothetical protein